LFYDDYKHLLHTTLSHQQVLVQLSVQICNKNLDIKFSAHDAFLE